MLLAREKLIEDSPQAVNVCALRNLPTGLRLFGRHVLDGANNLAFDRNGGISGVLLSLHLCQPKIHRDRFAVWSNHDIGRLEVPMENAVFMRKLDRVTDGGDYCKYALRRKNEDARTGKQFFLGIRRSLESVGDEGFRGSLPTFLDFRNQVAQVAASTRFGRATSGRRRFSSMSDNLCQGSTIDKFHCNINGAFGFSNLMDVADISMRKLSHNGRLAFKALKLVRRCALARLQHFDS